MRQAFRQLAFFCFIPLATFAALGSMYPFALGVEPASVQSLADSTGNRYRASVLESGGDLYVILERAAWKLSLGRAALVTTASPGQLRVQWTGSKDLTVTCHQCDRARTTISAMPKWREVNLHYVFDWN